MFSTKEHFFQLVGIYKEARSQINYENTYTAMIRTTDDQGAMCFLGLVIAKESHR